MSSKIDVLVKHILNENVLPEHRAIALFEFQVWVYYPGPHADADKDIEELTLKSEKKRRRARVFAATKLLDRIWDRLREECDQSFSVTTATSNPVFREIFDHYLTVGRGLYDIRNTPGGRSFRDDLRERVNAAKAVGGMIDFCLCYSRDAINKLQKNRGDKKSRPLGFEKLKRTLGENKKLAKRVMGRQLSASSIGTLRRQYFNSAPFIFLDHNPYVEPIFPENCRSKQFASRLLEIVGDTARLSQFFGQYEAIRARLEPLGYKFPSTGIKPVPFESVPISMVHDQEFARTI